MKEAIQTDLAPKAIGPYSQAISCRGTLYCSGQVPIDPKTGAMVEGGIEQQARQALNNLKAVIEEGGARMDNVLKTTILLKDLEDFKAVNGIYAEYFSEPYPARATFEVARLPVDAMIEIEAIVDLNT